MVKKAKSVMSKLLVCAMTLQMALPTSVQAAALTSQAGSEKKTESAVTGKEGSLPAPTNVKLEEAGDSYTITWDKSENAQSYKVMRAPSMFGKYEVVTTTEDTTATVTPPEKDAYSDYYRIVAVNGEEESEESDFVSKEKNMFGDHTLIFAPTDDREKVNKAVQDIFVSANDYDKDAQFKGEHWTIYYKPGDYTDTECVPVGFYTQVAGLGKVPTDVELNNIEVPAYLDGAPYDNEYWVGQGDNSGDRANATCNFWRSAENLSVTGTGDATVVDKVAPQSQNWAPGNFNWSVAQAAPLRRVYSTREVKYDWDWGWASGGYTADCLFTNEGGAGTASGQQFYTRNSEITGNAFGTTLNNFFQGVKAPSLPSAEDVTKGTAQELVNKNGYTNWGIPSESGDQQVFTNVETTPEIAEKPFLYLDGEEYKVFVPAVRKNAKGISWSKDNMGEGKSLPLSDFYIAKPSDSAKVINEQLAAGKNIYFTPGIYHAEEPIQVTNPDTVLLGTGMATIIPDNEKLAMEIADVDGVRVAGLIFDAGKSSEYLLVVGEEGKHTDHSANPIILQDLFFRVGGTTDELTKAENALEINSDNVIGDHFWIWRADHGAGVKWDGNESKHGLIVNGDNVNTYALFNEHFQEYTTLWNGENGANYFYQNETCYDPISQEAWMSHDGAVKGYSSYKVADSVNNHYTVGLGIYNVFIYTGPEYDSSSVQIQLDNAIEVPDKEGVLVENACLQTFADENKVLQKINTIVNGMGDPVSSGIDKVTGEKGTGWDRTFLRYYRNGEAIGSYRTLQKAYKDLINGCNSVENDKSKYSEESWSEFAPTLEDARKLIQSTDVYVKWPIQNADIEEAIGKLSTTLENVQKAAGDLKKSDKELAKDALAEELKKAEELKETDYPTDSWAAYQEAVGAAKVVSENADATLEELQNAVKTLQEAREKLTNPGQDPIVQKPSVKLNASSIPLQKGKSTTALKVAKKSPSNDKVAKWTSSNTKVATVSSSGKISAKMVGTATITVTMKSGATAKCTVKVQKGKVTTKKLTVASKTAKVKVKKSIQLTVTRNPITATEKITWSSSDKKIATVNSKGKVTGKKAGKATITAKTSNKKSVKIKVTVTK